MNSLSIILLVAIWLEIAALVLMAVGLAIPEWLVYEESDPELSFTVYCTKLDIFGFCDGIQTESSDMVACAVLGSIALGLTTIATILMVFPFLEVCLNFGFLIVVNILQVAGFVCAIICAIIFSQDVGDFFEFGPAGVAFVFGIFAAVLASILTMACWIISLCKKTKVFSSLAAGILVILLAAIIIVAVKHVRRMFKSSIVTNCVPELQGQVRVSFKSPSFEKIAQANPKLEPGGKYYPSDCVPVNGATAVVIPYRNRETQLRALLNHLHPILQRQQLHYAIIVVDQGGNQTFNRGMLMNIGYRASLTLKIKFECYIFHDVDLLPEVDRTIFTCKDTPVHFSGYIDVFDYVLPYEAIFGGVSAIPAKLFNKVNGYSNLFFGWGGEDDDMFRRLINGIGVNIQRPKIYSMSYKMIRHDHESSNPKNPRRIKLSEKAARRMKFDGLNTMKYRLIDTKLKTTHTHVLVDIDEKETSDAVFDKMRSIY